MLSASRDGAHLAEIPQANFIRELGIYSDSAGDREGRTFQSHRTERTVKDYFNCIFRPPFASTHQTRWRG